MNILGLYISKMQFILTTQYVVWKELFYSDMTQWVNYNVLIFISSALLLWNSLPLNQWISTFLTLVNLLIF